MITNKQKSVLFMLLSVLGFSLMAVAIKYVPEIPIYEKVFFRNSVSFLMASYFIMQNKVSFKMTKKDAAFVFFRSFFGFLGVVCNFYAIIHLSIGDSSLLNRLSPVFVTIVACLFFKERIDRKQFLGIIFMLLGAVLVIKPSFSMTIIPSLIGILSPMLGGISYNLIRALKDKVNPNVIVFLFSLFSVLCSIPLMYSDFVLPNASQLFFLIAIGVTASMGQFGLTYAYKYAKASEVSIYNYTGIIFGMLLGFAFFGEIPDTFSILGATIIITTAILLYRHNQKLNDA